ncbi:hypothetical protein AAG570_007731 [Ranatra chinensis]|uniref:Uncharacterized protein n=1 Tax=Ranatra chinensis TaxID=642074 RepID=A0ABD0XUE0_9HEMI
MFVRCFAFNLNDVADVYKKTGELAVVTGGARGIGLKLVKKLLECDMNVIIGCRNVDAGMKAVTDIRASGVTSGSVSVFKLDLESFDSIKEFATTVRSQHSFLNLLVNNAGIMFVPYALSEGIESHWKVNYLGPFYLTHLLMPLLLNVRQPKRSRIVNVTSCAHQAVTTFTIDTDYTKSDYIPSEAYGQSKLAQVLFTKELNRKLSDNNSNVTVLAVHPGIVDTDLFNGTLLKRFFPWILKYVCKNSEEGATTVLYACIAPQLDSKGGAYVSNCTVRSPSKLAENCNYQRKLFNHSLSFLRIDDFGKI